MRRRRLRRELHLRSGIVRVVPPAAPKALPQAALFAVVLHPHCSVICFGCLDLKNSS
jgi:hypothetical protein